MICGNFATTLRALWLDKFSIFSTSRNFASRTGKCASRAWRYFCLVVLFGCSVWLFCLVAVTNIREQGRSGQEPVGSCLTMKFFSLSGGLGMREGYRLHPHGFTAMSLVMMPQIPMQGSRSRFLVEWLQNEAIQAR
jgi:hypothetical protein